jgi:O-antigen/teichoic acid export membrane protein
MTDEAEPQTPAAAPPSTPAAAPPAAAPPAAQGAGRGVVLIAFAKFYFMFAGLILQVRLPAILSHAAYGAYSVVAGWVSPLNNVMVTGSIQAVSRFTAQRPEHARLVQHAGLRMHLYIGLPVALMFMAGSPLIAWFQHDWSLVSPLMVAAAIVAGYAFYAVFIGTANGLRQFHKQAGLDITFATLRVGAILAAATVGAGVVGMVAGWVAAVVVILATAAVWIGMPGRPAKADRLPVAPMAKFFIGVAIYLVLFNVLMFVDTWLLKRLATEYYVEHRVRLAVAADAAVPWLRGVVDYTPAPSTLADVQVAYYTVVQQLARLSYQAIIAATFVIFPLVSRTTFEGDRDTTKSYVQVTFRYSLMFATAIAVVMAANPTALLDVVFAADYAELGGPALAALALGNVAFSVFAIAGTILNGAGFTKEAIITAASTLALAVVGNMIAIPMVGPGKQLLLVTASVTSCAMLIGAITSGLVLRKKLGAFIPLLSVGRVIIAVAVAIGVGRVIPFRTPLMSLVEAGVVAVTFLAVLIATGELGKKDLAAIRRVRSKRGQGGET